MEILEVIFPVAALVFFGGSAYVVGKASKRWRKDFDEAMTELEEEHERLMRAFEKPPSSTKSEIRTAIQTLRCRP
jgi:hypothetical protein